MFKFFSTSSSDFKICLHNRQNERLNAAYTALLPELFKTLYQNKGYFLDSSLKVLSFYKLLNVVSKGIITCFRYQEKCSKDNQVAALEGLVSSLQITSSAS